MIINSKAYIGLNEDNTFLESAKGRKVLCHYSSLNNIYDILNLEVWKAKSITKYASKFGETIAYGGDYDKMIFFISFYNKIDENIRMWKYFGKANKGAKITLHYDKCFSDVILNKNRPISAYYCSENSDDEEFKCNFLFFNTYDNKYDDNYLNGKIEKFVLDYRLIDVDYKKKITSLFSKHEGVLVLNRPIRLKNDIKFQSETRLSLFLRTTRDIKTDDFNILHVPVSFNKFLKIEIELGKYVINKDEWKEKFESLAKRKKINLTVK